jgi:hypothetical protein
MAETNTGKGHELPHMQITEGHSQEPVADSNQPRKQPDHKSEGFWQRFDHFYDLIFGKVPEKNPVPRMEPGPNG